jgi:peptidyl-prolyl cis-trans isomerase A (cyclophilin A)
MRAGLQRDPARPRPGRARVDRDPARPRPGRARVDRERPGRDRGALVCIARGPALDPAALVRDGWRMITRASLLLIALGAVAAGACGGAEQARLRAIETRLAGVESDSEKIAAIETRVSELDTRTAALGEKLTRLEGLAAEVAALRERLDAIAGGQPRSARPLGKPIATEDVRPPEARDLDGYTRDLPGEGPLTATIETSQGTLHCTLLPEAAPMTVANFVGLARGLKAWRHPKSGEVTRKPFYDGLIFHRVIPEFMLQGGDPTGTGAGGPGYQFGDETSSGLRHELGTLSMANAGPGTNGGQFFITEKATPWLDGKHTIFGRCRETDLIKKIARVKRNAQDRPAKDVVIQRVTITRGE